MGTIAQQICFLAATTAAGTGGETQQSEQVPLKFL